MRHVSGLVSIGLGLGGGIASVTRSFVSALESVGASMADGERGRRLQIHALGDPREGSVMLDDGWAELCDVRGYGGSRLGLTWGTLREQMVQNSYLAFDHLGLARISAVSPWAGPYCMWVYGSELEALDQRTFGERALRHADLILAISEWTKTRAIKILPELEGRIELVRPCIEPRRERMWRGASWSGIERHGNTALIVGRMAGDQPGKGHKELIGIWPRVREEVEDARLLIVGDGDDRARLQSMASATEGVTFVGAVDASELARLYCAADIFVMPSRQDGFGIVYAEAMWHGLPCVASSFGGARAAVRDGETGVLVDPDDWKSVTEAIVRLFKDHDLRLRMSERAQRWAEEELTFRRFREDIARLFC